VNGLGSGGPESEAVVFRVVPVSYVGRMTDMAQKRKISVTLDDELVAVLEGAEGTLSSQVNEAVRVEVERRGRQTLLTDWLGELELTDGPVDEALVTSFVELLG